MTSIRPMTEADWPQVATIYGEGIKTGDATFETSVPTYREWDAAHLKECRLAAVADDGHLAGWAALSPVSSRCVYDGVAEVSVYVGRKYWRQNIGRLLLDTLVEESEREGYWTLQAGIFEENVASVALHHRCGFRTVGLRERIGCDGNGRWRNTLLLERRSRKVAFD